MVLEREKKKKTRIVCTIGPASESKEMLTKLVKAGMNVMRLNFSHGSHDEHLGKIEKIREVNKELNKNVAILLDTKGPEIRTGDFVGGKTEFKKGQVSVICTEDIEGTSDRFTITYKNLYQDVKPGGFILVNDGQIELLVDHVEGTDIVCVCANDGTVKNKRGINVPGVKLGFDYLSQKDIEDITFGCQQDVDFIAASFVRRPQDIADIRAILAAKGNDHIKIVSKIENQEGIDNMADIVRLSDGVMVARGDLGVGVDAWDVPEYQKQMIYLAQSQGKIIITATQMLDSMQQNPRPTRAEVSDVYNAVLDGTGCTMLSGESAQGDYPYESVSYMAKIDEKAEEAIDHDLMIDNVVFGKEEVSDDYVIGLSVATVCSKYDVDAVVACGDTDFAMALSTYRPACDVFFAVDNDRDCRTLSILWGIQGLVGNLDDALAAAKEALNLGEGAKVLKVTATSVEVVTL